MRMTGKEYVIERRKSDGSPLARPAYYQGDVPVYAKAQGPALWGGLAYARRWPARSRPLRKMLARLNGEGFVVAVRTVATYEEVS